ncbi:MAG: hypothetical protein ACE5FD_17530 [Anaerolineae bacterium]
MSRQTLFAGLVYDEWENLVETAVIGDESFYVVDDEGFRRHVNSEEVDRQVLNIFMDQLEGNRDIAVEQMMRLTGQEDIFAKAAIESQLDNISMEDIINQGIPEQARNMLGFLGFRIIINYHGQVVKLDQPTAPADE